MVMATERERAGFQEGRGFVPGLGDRFPAFRYPAYTGDPWEYYFRPEAYNATMGVQEETSRGLLSELQDRSGFEGASNLQEGLTRMAGRTTPVGMGDPTNLLLQAAYRGLGDKTKGVLTLREAERKGKLLEMLTQQYGLSGAVPAQYLTASGRWKMAHQKYLQDAKETARNLARNVPIFGSVIAGLQ